jgi:predicted phage terminase large subunit-like protein
MFTSFSDLLCDETTRDIQRIFTSDAFKSIFPRTLVGVSGYQNTSDLIEYAGFRGGFKKSTVGGQINGRGFDVGIVDDPIKGRAEAFSKTVRDTTWNWLTDDFFGRFSVDAGMLVVMTRWHVDDPMGRYLDRARTDQTIGKFKVLKFPAIAEKDERWRNKGEALFPQLKPLDFLLERKALLTESAWQALYQQNPIIVGGGILPVGKLKVVPAIDRKLVRKAVRYWDKAGTDSKDNPSACYTAGVLMLQMMDGTYVIEHIMRGQWSALEREERIKMVAMSDGLIYKSKYEIGVEQEGGSGGKESAESTVRNLAGFRVFVDRPTGSKETRAEPFAAQWQGGNLSIVSGDFYYSFIDEAEAWPASANKDQIDACSGAFNHMAGGPFDPTAIPNSVMQWAGVRRRI